MNEHLYHVTTSQRVNNIMKDGLIKCNSTFNDTGKLGIYLCKNPINWISLWTNPMIVVINKNKLNRESLLEINSKDELIYFENIKQEDIENIISIDEYKCMIEK